MTFDKDVREILKGAFSYNGKQVISDGNFVVSYNNEMVNIPKITSIIEEQNTSFKYLINSMEKIGAKDSIGTANINADELRAVVPTKKSEYENSLAKVGDYVFQTRYLSNIIDSLQNPVCYIKEYSDKDLAIMYIKADNGEAILLSFRQGIYSDRVKYSADIVVKNKETTKNNTSYSLNETNYVEEIVQANKSITKTEAENLAIIISTIKTFESSLDQKGNTINGSKKQKVQAYVNSLKLTAAQKYMIMGFMGYSNTNGEQGVKIYIQSLKLTKAQKELLFEMSGYKKSKS